MRVGGNPLAVDLAPEVQQLVFREPSLHEGARIDAGRRVALEIDQVAAVAVMGRIPEVLLAGAEQRSDRGEAGDMPAELVVVRVGARHHHHRVPAADRADALLEGDVAGRALLHVRRNGVDVRRIRRERDVGAGAASLVDQALEQVVRALGSFALQHRFERIEPFLGLEGVGVVRGGKLGDCGHVLDSGGFAAGGCRLA